MEEHLSTKTGNSNLYVGIFMLSFLIFLLTFSYRRKFKATEVGVGDYEDKELMATMQKVFPALHVWYQYYVHRF